MRGHLKIKPVMRGNISYIEEIITSKSLVKPVMRGHLKIKPVMRGNISYIEEIITSKSLVKPVMRGHLKMVKPVMRVLT